MTAVDPKVNIISTDILFKGPWGTVEAIVKGGACAAREYIESLQPADEKKILALLEHTARNGPPSNRQKFKKVEDKILEFKSFQMRLPCFFEGKGRIIITHGLTKKSDDLPRSDVDKAKRLWVEYLEAKQAPKAKRG